MNFIIYYDDVKISSQYSNVNNMSLTADGILEAFNRYMSNIASLDGARIPTSPEDFRRKWGGQLGIDFPKRNRGNF